MTPGKPTGKVPPPPPATTPPPLPGPTDPTASRGAGLTDWLTVQEVAEHLRLKARSIYEMVAREKIPYARAGGRLVFSRAGIEHWMQLQHRGSADTSTRRAELPPIIAGSHDPLMDWAIRRSNCNFALMTRGSRDGLKRMVDGEASAALIHLPASDLQSFNLHAVAEAVRDKPWVLLHWARREQGLVCARGNPRRIEGLASLRTLKLKVGRRQAGAGTRELFDLLCTQAKLPLSPRNISWHEGFTNEDDICQAVHDGEIDCGPAVHSAARRLGLHFIPLMTESVDLLIDRKSYFEPGMQALLQFARGKPFVDQARRMGGYDLSDFGAVRWNAR